MTADALEAELLRAYAEQADCYTRAVDRNEASVLQYGESALETTLSRLQSELDAVAMIELRIAPAKSRWQSLGRKPGQELRKALARVEASIRRLGEQVNRLEALAGEAKARLSPAIDALARGQRMKNAYRLSAATR